MQHVLQPNKSGGKREMGWIQPNCSCGWHGSKHYAYNDYQHSAARDEGRKHLNEEEKS